MFSIGINTASAVTLDQQKNLEEYTKNYDSMSKITHPVAFSENQALITFQLMVQKDGCVISSDKVKWTVSGTADVTYDSDEFIKSISYDENYASAYCLINANSPGTVNIKATEFNPFNGREVHTFFINLNVDENGKFDGTVNYDDPDKEIPTEATDSSESLLGDANNDGYFNLNDIVMLQKYLTGMGKLTNWKNVDFYEDGKINILDLCTMKRVLMKENAISAHNLTFGIKSEEVKGAEADDKFILGQTEFALSLLKNTAEDKTNTLISPYSIMQALAMTANGADNETLAEMEKALGGLSIEKLNEYLYTWRTSQPDSKDCKLKTANSVWYRNDANLITVLPEFLQTNADYYNASAFSAPFDDSTVNDINTWVSQKTDKMIPKLLDNIDVNAVMYLINAVTFDAKWQSPYDEAVNGKFTAFDGSVQKAEMMYSNENYYLEDENASGFLKYYKDGRYAFAALLPNEEISLSEYIDSLTPESLYNTLSNPQNVTVEAGLPKFSYDYDIELKDTLSKMGMPVAFTTDADFSKMAETNTGFLNISKVLHKTHIDVFEEGTKAAAVTSTEMKAGCPMIEKTVILNRPFVYCIVDTQTSLLVFIGTLTSIPN